MPFDISTSPQRDSKLKKKYNACRFQFGSPKLRDILREKCRSRIKEARFNAYEKNRGRTDKILMQEILREELAELEKDINLQELIYKEMLEEVNDWLLDNFIKEENYLIETSSENIVFCPICEKSLLTRDSLSLKCHCGISFSYSGTLEEFQKQINNVIHKHEIDCSQKLIFFVEPNTTSDNFHLNVICNECDFYHYIK